MTAAVLLPGCQPEPLGSYLKALGVLRLVAEQVDPAARGHWTDAGFVLTSTLDLDGLVTFFADAYLPTPIVSPWNGGSGFMPWDKDDVLQQILKTPNRRFREYALSIEIGREAHQATAKRLGLIVPDKWTDPLKAKYKEALKPDLARALRSHLPDKALEWLDATVVLLDDDLGFPPILGTGGNDGRLDFSSNYMQRLITLLGLVGPVKRGAPSGPAWFRSAFDGTAVAGVKAAIGQFDPGGSGGPGSGPMAAAPSVVNPADFVLLLEGAMVLAAGPSRRLVVGTTKRAAMPFTFESSPVGYPSAALGEDSRGELWLPLWVRPAAYAEIVRLFAEGRCSWSGSQARSGLDAARAAVTLGAERGITAFSRTVLATRNGLSTVAIPVGRIRVVERPSVNVLGELDGWLLRVKRGKNPPNAVVSGVNAVERAMYAAAIGSPAAILDVLAAVGSLERTVGTATTFRKVSSPLRLEPARWALTLRDVLSDLADPTPARIALGVASLRSVERDGSSAGGLLRPVRPDGPSLAWSDRSVVAGLGRVGLLGVLAELHRRVLIETGASASDGSVPVGGMARGVSVPAADAVRLATGAVDLAEVERLLAGFLVFDWRSGATVLQGGSEARAEACPAFALLAASVGSLPDGVPGPDRRAVPSWVTRLGTGSAHATAEVLVDAGRRLGIAGWRVLVSPGSVAAGAPPGPALAAALLLHLPPSDRRRLVEQVADLPSTPTGPPTAAEPEGA